ncbi:MAG TPA: BamA/TamA family outer membrane protein [Chitinophagales bacterium]|nr:BamA/TamA family outer membrane protein [Chitinophagales bacterium]
MKHAWLTFAAALLSFCVNAQDSTKAFVHVRNINVEGNRRTKPHIVFRQLTFAQGDSVLLDVLLKEFDKSRKQLLNIGLFTDAALNISNWIDDSVDVKITVWERWYTLPGVTLDIYDRNFNTWWVEHDHDWRRVQYGIRFLQQNVRGRDEDLTLTALFGFAQRFDAGYHFPYVNNKMTLGLKTSAFFARQRQVTYDNYYNKDRFHVDIDRFIRNTWGAQTELIYKPRFHFRQHVALSYNDSRVADTIVALNPNYFREGSNQQRQLALRLSTVYDKRDWAAYPFKGYYLEGSVTKTGLGILNDEANVFTLVGVYQHYQQWGKRFFTAYQLKGKHSLPNHQPYYNLKGLGYRSDYVSGYEYYVVDGPSFALGKVQAKVLMFTLNFPVMRLLRKQDVKIPIHFLAKAYADAGYVSDYSNLPKNLLADTWMTGTGVGLDVATAYDFAVKFEYSVNRRGEKGLFLHFAGSF